MLTRHVKQERGASASALTLPMPFHTYIHQDSVVLALGPEDKPLGLQPEQLGNPQQLSP